MDFAFCLSLCSATGIWSSLKDAVERQAATLGCFVPSVARQGTWGLGMEQYPSLEVISREVVVWG